LLKIIPMFSCGNFAFRNPGDKYDCLKI